CHSLGGMYGEPLVHQQLPQRHAAPDFPVVVVAPRFAHEPTDVASAAGGGVPDGVRQFVPDPERKQLWSESEAVGLGIDPSSEVLEADEGNPAPINDELARI